MTAFAVAESVVEQLATEVVERTETARLTLCGSTRFRAEYELWNKRLTLAGFLVYSVSGFGHSGDTFTDEQKRRLDQIHLAKIDAAHAIVVINPDGYIGDSTRREIEHAQRTGKRVYYTHVGMPTVYQLRTGPVGGSSLRYRAFDYGSTPIEDDTPTVTGQGVIPDDIAAKVREIGRAEWGQTHAYDAEGHGRHIADSVRMTAAHFGQTGDQHMHGLFIEGTETVICHTGTSPNSPQIARALTGTWNWLHDQATTAHPTPSDGLLSELVEALAKGSFMMTEPSGTPSFPRARKLVIGFENPDHADDAMAAVGNALRKAKAGEGDRG
jgi:hypothetical protein